MLEYFASIDWSTYWEVGKPLLLWVGGMVLYSVFVFSFYERVSRKFIFDLELPSFRNSKHAGFLRWWWHAVYTMKYFLFAPVFLFGWFVILAGLLLILEQSMPLVEALLIGMATLATIRICAHINEHLAEDLAKFFPLSFLGYFVLSRSQLSIPIFFDKLKEAPELLSILLTYFAVVVVLEFILRAHSGFSEKITN